MSLLAAAALAAVCMARAVVKTYMYSPRQASIVVSQLEGEDFSFPMLPAYVMKVNGEPTAALLYDTVGSEVRAIRFVYNATAMSRDGHMTACRKLMDRKSVDYDFLPLSDWFALVGSTKQGFFLSL